MRMRPDGRMEKPRRVESSVRRPAVVKPTRTLKREPLRGHLGPLEKQRRPDLRENVRRPPPAARGSPRNGRGGARGNRGPPLRGERGPRPKGNRGPPLRNERGPALRDNMGPPPRDERGPPRDGRGPPPRENRGPPIPSDRGPPLDHGPRNDRGPPMRDSRGPPFRVVDGRGPLPRDSRGQPSGDVRGPSRDNRGPPSRDVRGPPRDYRGPHDEPLRNGRGPPLHDERVSARIDHGPALREPYPDNLRHLPARVELRPPQHRDGRSPLPFRDEPRLFLQPRTLRHDDIRQQFPDTGPPVHGDLRSYRGGMRSPSPGVRPPTHEEFRTPQSLRRRAASQEPINRLIPPPNVRQALLMRSRSPIRQKRPPPSKATREGDAPKRARESFEGRKLERPPYDEIIEGELRLPKKDLCKLVGDEARRYNDRMDRRPVPARAPEYGDRGMERPSSVFGPPRGREPPPMDRPLKDYPPRTREGEWNDAMRMLRMEEVRHMQNAADFRKGMRGEPSLRPLPPGMDRRDVGMIRVADFARERARLPFPRDIDPRDTRLRPMESRRSLERELDRREREWRAREGLRLSAAPPMTLRGRSAERTTGFLLPPGYRRQF